MSTSPSKVQSTSGFDDMMDNEALSEKVHHSSLKYSQEVEKLTDSEIQKHILVAQKLSKTYDCTQGKKQALQDFSIKLSKDRIFGLLGPNGAGKTTFLSIVTGAVRQDSGEA